MRKLIFTTIGILFCVQFLFAQGEDVSLILQSPHGHTVKMIWFFKNWNSEIKGFDIKRKEGLQKEWVKLNKEPILPEILLKKNLAIVESDKTEAERIKSVLINYISDHTLSEMDTNTFLNKMNTDNLFLRDFSKMISEDYDIALISGFAYIDHTATKKIDYEYGLFIHGTDKLLAKANWNYGEYPDLNLITEITSKSTFKKRGVQIIWDVDLKKLKAGYVHGFNIYRDGIRLNLAPVMIAYNNDLSEFEWYDSTANSRIPNQYSIGSESLLDIEGIIKTYTYNPADHPEEYKKAELSSISSLGYYFKEGIQVNWDFPKEYEHFVKGFFVEKDNIPGGYKQVSTLLDPSSRDFIDKTASPVSSYIRFRVGVIYNDKSIIQGTEKIYNYFPIREPPQPQNLRAKTKIGAAEKIFTVNLSWDAPINGDTLTDYYQVYSSDVSSDKLYLNAKIPPIKSNKYSFEIKHGHAGKYKLCISSMSKYKTESPLSDTIVVQTPTLDLPKPVISKIAPTSNNPTLQWQYPEIPDLLGFRIFQNKTLIADEDEIHKNDREFIIPSLKWETSYEFTIQAVTEQKLVSDISDVSPVTIPAKPRRK